MDHDLLLLLHYRKPLHLHPSTQNQINLRGLEDVGFIHRLGLQLRFCEAVLAEHVADFFADVAVILTGCHINI